MASVGWGHNVPGTKSFLKEESIDPMDTEGKGKVHGILNASSKICSLVVNGQSFLVTDGSLLNLF